MTPPTELLSSTDPRIEYTRVGHAGSEDTDEAEEQVRLVAAVPEVVHHERRRLYERTLDAINHERGLIAEELHDGPMQQLAYLGYTIDLLELKLENGLVDEAVTLLGTVRGGLTREMGALRRLMFELHVPVGRMRTGDGGTEHR